MIYHVTCNTDNNYAQHCCAMLCSLFETNKDLRFVVHILTNELNNDIKTSLEELAKRYNNELKFYIVDETQLEGLQYREKRPLTKAAYYRILLPSIIPSDIDKILYLDCDMIVLQSVEELFDIDIDEYALAATTDSSPFSEIHRRQLGFDMNSKAFCSGIMLINLKYWRGHNAQNRLIEFSKQKRYPVYLHDQDALNRIFKNQWFVLSSKFNHTTLSICSPNKFRDDILEYTFNPVVWHYSSDLKPWFNISFPGKKNYIKYLRISEFSAPKFVKVKFKYRISVYSKIIRYYLSLYLYPVVPRIVELLIRDIYTYTKGIGILLMSPKKYKRFIVSEWEKRRNN